MDYKIATPYGLYDFNNEDEDARRKFSYMQDTYLPSNPVTVVQFDCAFSNMWIGCKVNIFELIEGLAIKDGIDVIEYENGCRGVVAYYNMHKSFVMMLDEGDEDYSKLLNLRELHSDRDFRLVTQFKA